MKRLIEDSIKLWISTGKKALLLTGARQVGKTYIIRKLLSETNSDFIEINFIANPELITLFKDIKSNDELLLRLSILSSNPVVKGKTIIFIDEVQECKDFLTNIKFLVDDSSFRYILSGSLLGVELTDLRSAPVGYVELLTLYPMNFMEFLIANQISQTVINHLHDSFNSFTPVDDLIHTKILDLFYLYQIVGGMPDSIKTYLDTSDLRQVKNTILNIYNLYNIDFTKYERNKKLLLHEIFDAIPSELSNQNKRFKFSSIKPHSRFDRLENDFLWLKDAGVVLPVYNVSEPKSPLIISSNRNLFKLFYSDIGLLSSQYSDNTTLQILAKNPNINNGSLFENYVAQELTCSNVNLYYYNSKKFGELDFVIELDNSVIPIEVKSGKDYKRHSALINIMNQKEYNIRHAYVLSNSNLHTNDKIIYLPIYMTMFIKEATNEPMFFQVDSTGLK